MTHAIATIRRVCPHTGKVIAGPAHLFAPPRIKASDVVKHGGLENAKREIWGAAR